MLVTDTGLSDNGLRSCRRLAEIAPPEPAAALEREIASLSRNQQLVSTGRYSVYVASQSRVPRVLLEIGRLREVCFRSVGEGSGAARDLDRYDEWYMHLFAWDNQLRRIAGAYRLCMTDVALRQQGSDALYTRELFHYEPDLLDRLPPVVELGRSFVCPQYQGAGGGLAVLWRGIGQLLARRPRYRALLGPVSVSAQYSDASRQLIASVLHSGSFRHKLSSYVRARRPVDAAAVVSVMDVAALSKRVSEFESDDKGLPVLVREYVRLGGKFLSFSIDPGFQDAMDGLVVVELDQTQRRLLQMYMGRDGYDTFTAARPEHARAVPTAAE